MWLRSIWKSPKYSPRPTARRARHLAPGNRRPEFNLLLETLEDRVTPAIIGYYQMDYEEGNINQETAILAAGHTPVYLSDVSSADLAGIDVLDVQNGNNDGYGFEYLSRLAEIESAVAGGMVLVIHDRYVDDAESILPGGGSFNIIRDFADDANIDVLDDTTLVTNGPGGLVDNSTLDFGISSSHGFAFADSLSASANLILSQGDPTHVVTFAYGYGAGTVIYSSIPLDYYRDYFGNNFGDIYAPNVLAYAATNAQSGFGVTGTNPANGSVVATTPTQYIVNVNDAVVPETVDAGDFQVNGISATAFAYTPGANSITFTFASDPVTEQGLQHMHVANGAFTSVSDGTGVREFNGAFRYDVVLMQVTSTDPTDGSPIVPPANILDLNFNEAYDFDSAQISDFIVNQGFVSEVSQVDADTLRLTFSGIDAGGTLTVSMPAGAMTDVYGNRGAEFFGSYTVPPSVRINDVTVTESSTGTVNATFTVTLSALYGEDVIIPYTTANGTATAGSDYAAVSGNVTIPAGFLTNTFTVVVSDDRLAELTENFVVNLGSPANAGVSDGQGVGSIVDNEPRISIGDVSHKEGNGNGKNTTAFVFRVSLSAAYDQTVTVNYSTVLGGTATAGSDYQEKNGTVTFLPGQTTQNVTILVYRDNTLEANETFFVDLSNPSTNALIIDPRGIGTILNDDR